MDDIGGFNKYDKEAMALHRKVADATAEAVIKIENEVGPGKEAAKGILYVMMTTAANHAAQNAICVGDILGRNSPEDKEKQARDCLDMIHKQAINSLNGYLKTNPYKRTASPDDEIKEILRNIAVKNKNNPEIH